MCVIVAQSCPTLCKRMDCSPPGSSFHGIFPGKNTGVGCISFSRGSSQPRDQTHVTCLLHWQAGSSPLASPGKPPHVLGKTKPKKELISSLAHHNCEEMCGPWSLHSPDKLHPLDLPPFVLYPDQVTLQKQPTSLKPSVRWLICV